jgi:hypothetical protein
MCGVTSGGDSVCGAGRNSGQMWPEGQPNVMWCARRPSHAMNTQADSASHMFVCRNSICLEIQKILLKHIWFNRISGWAIFRIQRTLPQEVYPHNFCWREQSVFVFALFPSLAFLVNAFLFLVWCGFWSISTYTQPHAHTHTHTHTSICRGQAYHSVVVTR